MAVTEVRGGGPGDSEPAIGPMTEGPESECMQEPPMRPFCFFFLPCASLASLFAVLVAVTAAVTVTQARPSAAWR